MLKHRFAVMLITILVLFSSFALFALPAYADDGVCVVFEYRVTNQFLVTATETAELYNDATGEVYGSSSITLDPGETGVNRVVIFVSSSIQVFVRFSGTLMGSFIVLMNDIVPDACGFGQINDGRINSFDLAAPLAAYCADGGIAVWDIGDDGEGTLGFTASADEIADALANAAASGQNVLVGEGLGNSLYALSTNELALVGPDVKEPGKTYTYIAAAGVCA